MDPRCQRTAITRTLPAALLACAMGLAGADAAAQAAATPPADHALLEARIPLSAGGAITPKYLYLFSPSAHWRGAMRWKYNHANAPAALAADKAGVIAQLQKSFDKWSSQCGITYQYDGETTTPPNNTYDDPDYGPQPDGASVVGWGALSDPSLGAWTYAWYAQESNDRIIFDADVTLSVANIASMADLDRLMTHEWGHALGLDHSNTEAAIMAGPPSTHYNGLVTPQPDDVRGCRCLYGLPAGVSSPYVCQLPSKVDFGSAAVGRASPAQMVTFTNSGNAPLSIATSTVTNSQFAHVAGCTPGTVVSPGASCTVQVQVTPSAAGAQTGQLALYTNDGYYELSLAANGVQSTGGEQVTITAPTVEVVEYYNASLDHYFITWIAAEIANLDAGNTPTPWTRTGRTFRALTTPQPGTSQVCRFYIPPADGNSHFFGRSTGECAASQTAHPDFVLEDPAYMQTYLPTAGVCPAGTQALYRLFNNRPDANHRYTIDRALRDAMVAEGWVAEGDGPDAVAMCVPQQ
jgi:hypothetical protein